MGLLSAFAALWGDRPLLDAADPLPLILAKSYRDPAGRFELAYPREWDLDKDWGIEVTSPCLGSFARVDVVGPSDPLCATARRRVEEAGGEFALRHHCHGRAEHERGELLLGRRRYLWEAYGYPAGRDKAVLTRALIVSEERGLASRHYLMRVLSEILKRFRAEPATK